MNKKIGFLVGRFQTPELTSGQINVLKDFINQNYEFNGIILGVPATKATAYNPLDFDSRRRMIEDTFPRKFQFGYIKDECDDFIWSNHLDDTISKMLYNYVQRNMYSNDFVIIHGSKETVLSKYFGKFDTKEINTKKVDSTEFLKEFVSKKVNDSASWRAGACWSATNRYPVAYHTVDCAIFDDRSYTKVWMGRKENESKLRFIGGFVDPNDNSAELAAIREAEEETGLKCTCITDGYISSRKIDDWRYKNEEDKIITTCYALMKHHGTPKAGDDMAELYKVDILNLNKENVIPIHRELLEDVQEWIKRKLHLFPFANDATK